MKKILTSYLFWGIMLIGFIIIILWDDSLLKKIEKKYVKQKMKLAKVHFNQIDNGFEYAKMYADYVNMDDRQNDMIASNVKVIFFKKDVATWTGILLADRAVKNPFEAKFWGHIRAKTSDDEAVKTEEFKYYFKLKELFTQKPVTIWKGNAVITGKGLRYKTQKKEAQILNCVKIRIWNNNASNTENIKHKSNKNLKPTDKVATIPVAPPLSQLLLPCKINNKGIVASKTVNNIKNKDAEKENEKEK